MKDEIMLIRLTDIEVPEAWNARSGAWHENAADLTSDDGGYEGIKASMAAKGRNDTPVLLRLHPALRGPGFILVDGFRRMRIAKELGWTHLRAVVEEMSDYEARRRNIQAQTSHERLKPADLAWAVSDLKRLGGPKLTDEEIGTAVGISGMYAGTLRRIMQDVDSKVTEAWRASPVRVDVAELQRLTVLPPEQHWAKWQDLVLDKQTRPHGSSKATAYLRLETRCHEKGKELGNLERIGFLTVNPVDWKLAVAELFSPKWGADFEKLSQAMLAGYHEGLERKDETK